MRDTWECDKYKSSFISFERELYTADGAENILKLSSQIQLMCAVECDPALEPHLLGAQE